MSIDATATPCPECTEPVSALANYCPHCGAALSDEGREVAGSDGRSPGDDGSRDAPATDRIVDPDSTLDVVLGVGLGCLVGAVVAVTVFLTAVSFSGGLVSLLAALFAAIASGGAVATQDTAGDGLRYGSYVVGVGLLLPPLVAFSPAAEGGDTAGRLLLFLAGEALFGLAALVVAAVGYGATVGFDRIRGLR